MSFYITLKTLKFQISPINKSEKILIVIKSHNKQLLTYSTKFTKMINWQQSFVAESNERQIELILVKEIMPNKKVKKISTNMLNLGKHLFEAKQRNIDNIVFYNYQGKKLCVLQLQILYKKNKKFIGPIQFFKRGMNVDDQQQRLLLLDIQDDKNRNSFFKWNFFSSNQTKNTEKNIKFYKGAHINRNLFSFCDTVFDDQKFTIVQHDYNEEN